jgi:hypothetical protein
MDERRGSETKCCEPGVRTPGAPPGSGRSRFDGSVDDHVEGE